MFFGQAMKSVFQPEAEDNNSCMNNRINFSDFFLLFFFSQKLNVNMNIAMSRECTLLGQ